MKNLFPIICTVLILVGGATGLIYFTQPETESESEFFKEVSIENLQEEVKDVASELLMDILKNHIWCKHNSLLTGMKNNRTLIGWWTTSVTDYEKTENEKWAFRL